MFLHWGRYMCVYAYTYVCILEYNEVVEELSSRVLAIGMISYSYGSSKYIFTNVYGGICAMLNWFFVFWVGFVLIYCKNGWTMLMFDIEIHTEIGVVKLWKNYFPCTSYRANIMSYSYKISDHVCMYASLQGLSLQGWIDFVYFSVTMAVLCGCFQMDIDKLERWGGW